MMRRSTEYLYEFFEARRYTATKWVTREDKQKFAVDLVRFVESGYKFSMFRQSLYARLSNCFGHIAHVNRYGFYEEWFSTPDKQAFWKTHIVGCRVCGDPAWTFSDVELDIRSYAEEHW